MVKHTNRNSFLEPGLFEIVIDPFNFLAFPLDDFFRAKYNVVRF